MLIVLGALGVVVIALLIEVSSQSARRGARALVARRARAREPEFYDPGRERRAEARARALLRSCVNEEDWAMYRDLGFLRVWGSAPGAPRSGAASYAYLIYPHRPIVAYVPQTDRLLSEYCVQFPDRQEPPGCSRLPASDDVLAKWMALSADERWLIAHTNMHLAGRQVDPAMVRADLARLRAWERERLGGVRGGAGSVPIREHRSRLRRQAPQPDPHRGS